ncbi:hypothetical protein BC827DRAFT_1196615 [Russula dissimulans]|nr:hypothetical protein BC827DRAFT_1196615 [Russula dissimulans]
MTRVVCAWSTRTSSVTSESIVRNVVFNLTLMPGGSAVEMAIRVTVGLHARARAGDQSRGRVVGRGRTTGAGRPPAEPVRGCFWQIKIFRVH